jgi:hypothetical protein
MIDGSGSGGESFFSWTGRNGVIFEFDSEVLGFLPTHAGIVWTDGDSTITFEAYDAFGRSLGTVQGNHATAGHNGQTNEDRFYGVIETAGISAIKISNAGGGIEVDHLQYGIPDRFDFLRGDSSADGKLNTTDVIYTLNFLFLGSPTPTCFDAVDADDDGQLDLTDAVYTLMYLFLGGSPPPDPGPDVCGPDPTGDGLACLSYDPCAEDAPAE